MTPCHMPPPAPALSRRAALAGAAGVLGLGAAGCSSGARGEGNEAITIGYLPAWTDATSMAYLLQHQLEQLGHTVELESFHDAAIAFAALSEGDLDLYSSAWPDVTHAGFMDHYGANLEDLVTYNESASTMLAVPEHTGITSIEDLAADPERFDGRIIGIEPGAGLTSMVQGTVMPRYGLEEEFELITSSTPAMMTELQNAVDEQTDIVVTLWRPSLADRSFPVRPLEDPAGAFIEPESMHVMGRDGFVSDHAEAADLIGRIQLSDEEYRALEGAVMASSSPEGGARAVAAWTEENPAALPLAGA